ncbi:hypothetical protein M407DRAFT_25445 [Tulasnella calospora MUT 4182]|uniref:UvrD-like helicase C-terminal domain-containing protein n=1 Tax=Tulasnella calospora MUT 4182 TaxID=1051891 RepID=A0A0C3LV03_9AGAM|nr:hypothetical protein M407DRAFT_25445 [Tulasnella calospora MUT 4182]
MCLYYWSKRGDDQSCASSVWHRTCICVHKAQGQTLDWVIVNIGKPATGSINQFNAYVALSRGRNPEKVWLLRPFEMQLFTQGVDPDLAEEDIRLERLNDETRRAYEMESPSMIATCISPPMLALSVVDDNTLEVESLVETGPSSV